MLSKLITFALITSLLAAPSPAKDATNADLDGLDFDLDGLFDLADLGGVAGRDTEITRETREDEELNFALNQIVEEIEETGDNEEDDLFGRRIVDLEEEVKVEEEDETSVKSDIGDEADAGNTEPVDTISEEGGSEEEDSKYKGKGHNYKHKKMGH